VAETGGVDPLGQRQFADGGAGAALQQFALWESARQRLDGRVADSLRIPECVGVDPFGANASFGPPVFFTRFEKWMVTVPGSTTISNRSISGRTTPAFLSEIERSTVVEAS
jgi:hypothetical protein